ncbi:uncharacterized protein PADG_11556 [Paracoccidioides brasiliensis Pb18]|uniref:Uncharacterized protein n=1 Tax=Paracoccidioides brasiliensis (strain Pb18) TaxID=502780 RepID=A0A0A0HUS2_PARBD|nr:uncharacterized protein PADG_11556 [Paracoccidioides brasiliensis Pb18]KGM92357.1 hypothetical protein PADG_11556 [Paracoccidioides brasiliensis Pb18]
MQVISATQGSSVAAGGCLYALVPSELTINYPAELRMERRQGTQLPRPLETPFTSPSHLLPLFPTSNLTSISSLTDTGPWRLVLIIPYSRDGQLCWRLQSLVELSHTLRALYDPPSCHHIRLLETSATWSDATRSPQIPSDPVS